MSEIKLKCPTCGNTPRLFLERFDGELLIAARCECGNYYADDDISDFMKFWEVDETTQECELCHPRIEAWLSDQSKYDAYCGKCRYPLADGELDPLWAYCPRCGTRFKEAGA